MKIEKNNSLIVQMKSSALEKGL